MTWICTETDHIGYLIYFHKKPTQNEQQWKPTLRPPHLMATSLLQPLYFGPS